jgi:hypothetical protein
MVPVFSRSILAQRATAWRSSPSPRVFRSVAMSILPTDPLQVQPVRPIGAIRAAEVTLADRRGGEWSRPFSGPISAAASACRSVGICSMKRIHRSLHQHIKYSARVNVHRAAELGGREFLDGSTRTVWPGVGMADRAAMTRFPGLV